ncbi:UbiA family prenyltransferase [Silvibacterium dinghuense]|uniref:UbiA family prenyltransferase n=1 Tax=Silvibacterium dinghuense TaxID=1560006 RepID=A0A4Q1SJB8_9BACT|nr:UbiA family prenyltransferase [Silvibacterium dinghuense]RXS97525.1 UbiA family prenyltransferase [Silvibacterium dinghuense]
MVSQAVAPDKTVIASQRALCVDLDGTLVKSDTLIDSLLLLARTYPLKALQSPLWISGGKAALKARVGALVQLDPAHLPYNRQLLEYLTEQHNEGRKLYLTTGADATLAQRIADHLGIFEEVLASDGATNLTGHNKLESLQRRFAEGFDYIGNARPDLTLLQHSGEPMVANPDRALRGLLNRHKVTVARQFDDRAPIGKILFKTIRLHQWAKNVLIFVPLLLAHILSLRLFSQALVAFLSFSLCASATYIVNDLLDIEADRRHPKKRRRPFASGDLSPKTGVLISVTFLAMAFAGAAWLPIGFLGWLLTYLVTTLAYSLHLKRVVLIDVVLLSGLYTLRMLAGGAATSVTFSPWLAALSVFLFLSLAMVKRFSELQNVRASGNALSNGRGYLLADIEQLRSFGTASAYAAVVVFALYINSPDIMDLYHHPTRMWLMTPLMILWLSRVWLLASRGELDEDPVIFAVTDKMSLLIGACIAVIAVLAAI